MKAYYKLALALLPFLAAGALASTVVLPACQEDQEKRSEASSKLSENRALENKLKERKKAESDRKSLESDIEMLRGSVPKSPELDLFMLDLEKMCKQAGVELIGVETPDTETLRSMEEQSKETAKPAAPAKSADVKRAAEKQSPKEDVAALKQLVKQVYVTGNYDQIVGLMKELEHYQRITGVRQVSVAISPTKDQSHQTSNPASERAKKLNLPADQPVMSFLMTLYYLP